MKCEKRHPSGQTRRCLLQMGQQPGDVTEIRLWDFRLSIYSRKTIGKDPLEFVFLNCCPGSFYPGFSRWKTELLSPAKKSAVNEGTVIRRGIVIGATGVTIGIATGIATGIEVIAQPASTPVRHTVTTTLLVLHPTLHHIGGGPLLTIIAPSLGLGRLRRSLCAVISGVPFSPSLARPVLDIDIHQSPFRNLWTCRKASAWDVTPPGLQGVNIQTLAAINPAIIAPFMAPVNPQATRQARRLYVGNIPTGTTEESLKEFINSQMLERKFNTFPGPPCIEVQMNLEKGFAFIELRAVEDATNGMQLDGVIFNGNSLRIKRPKDYQPPPPGLEGAAVGGPVIAGVNLGLSRVAPSPSRRAPPSPPRPPLGIPSPTGAMTFVLSLLPLWFLFSVTSSFLLDSTHTAMPPLTHARPTAAPLCGPAGTMLPAGTMMPPMQPMLGPGMKPIISTTVADSPNKIFVGGLPSYLTEEHIKELLATIGPLRSFNLVRDAATGNSKGYAFLEYLDPSLTDAACSGLNGIKLGEKTLIVQRASVGAKKRQEGTATNLLTATLDAATIAKLTVGGPNAVTCAASSVLMLLNMLTLDDIRAPEDEDDIVRDVQMECERHGMVKQIHVHKPPLRPEEEKEAAGGAQTMPGTKTPPLAEQEHKHLHLGKMCKIFVAFENPDQARAASQALAGRRYQSRTVVTAFFPETLFEQKIFPD
ncbi:putative Splicing factor U2AF 50 kDa subunit [Paratrimastix pyriformis]|uniref:Splicing factor U2AF 50 kDa subunit n=1 Tax=Paratrimastix pyriformis TaxID=342808 RepID=A0ABQ8UD87_9EUKA|nr:putative Splicing factor U2AF 50 kDa subunit [Paratrimastix pyriformis]